MPKPSPPPPSSPPPSSPLSPRALNRALLARQLLLSRAAIPPLAALEQLAGLQAQLARPPFIGLWTRLANFDLPDAPRPPPDSPAPIRFVPDFDNLVLGHDDRRRIIADEHRPQLTTKNLQVKATFLVDGFAAGTWKIDRTKRAASLVLSPFTKLARSTRASLEEEGERLLSFVEPDAPTRSISVSPA